MLGILGSQKNKVDCELNFVFSLSPYTLMNKVCQYANAAHLLFECLEDIDLC